MCFSFRFLLSISLEGKSRVRDKPALVIEEEKNQRNPLTELAGNIN